jgi:hypothetical protein
MIYVGCPALIVLSWLSCFVFQLSFPECPWSCCLILVIMRWTSCPVRHARSHLSGVVALCPPCPCSRVVVAVACLALSRLPSILLLDCPKGTVQLSCACHARAVLPCLAFSCCSVLTILLCLFRPIFLSWLSILPCLCCPSCHVLAVMCSAYCALYFLSSLSFPAYLCPSCSACPVLAALHYLPLSCIS